MGERWYPRGGHLLLYVSMSKKNLIRADLNKLENISAECDPLISHAVSVSFSSFLYCSNISGAVDDMAQQVLTTARKTDSTATLSGIVLYDGQETGLCRFLFNPEDDHCYMTFEPANREFIEEYRQEMYAALAEEQACIPDNTHCWVEVL